MDHICIGTNLVIFITLWYIWILIKKLLYDFHWKCPFKNNRGFISKKVIYFFFFFLNKRERKNVQNLNFNFSTYPNPNPTYFSETMRLEYHINIGSQVGAQATYWRLRAAYSWSKYIQTPASYSKAPLCYMRLVFFFFLDIPSRSLQMHNYIYRGWNYCAV